MFGGKAKIPLVVRTVHGAGASAAAQHSQSLYNMFAAIPGVKVVVSRPFASYGLDGTTTLTPGIAANILYKD
jgi:pyruvate/2-oxoglutarate/acetoin dehydrogenase E1 component